MEISILLPQSGKQLVELNEARTGPIMTCKKTPPECRGGDST